MRILLLNGILWSVDNGVIKPRESIADCLICTFARGLVSNGHQVTLVAAEPFRPLRNEHLGFEIVFLPPQHTRLFKPTVIPYMPKLTDYLRRHADEFDLIISSEAFTLMTWQAARIAPKKLVVWQEMYTHQRKFFTLASRLWHNVVVRSTMRRALFVGRSRRAAQFISRYTTRVANEWVDNCADAELLTPANTHKRYFIVVAQLVQRKRVDLIISRFARLLHRPEYDDFRLAIAGDGPLRESLNQLAQRLGIDTRIDFHRHLPHSRMAALIRSATASLIATEKDLNMVAIPEAIASGTPIVANSTPANAEFIAQNRLGIINDNWNEEHLAHIIEHYAEYHQNCLNFRQQFTNIGAAKRLVEIFLEQR